MGAAKGTLKPDVTMFRKKGTGNPVLIQKDQGKLRVASPCIDMRLILLLAVLRPLELPTRKSIDRLARNDSETFASRYMLRSLTDQLVFHTS